MSYPRPTKIRSQWFRDNEIVKCHWCPKILNLKGSVETNPNYCTIDHVVETALGGTNDPANLVPACERCNSSRSSHIKNKTQEFKRLADV